MSTINRSCLIDQNTRKLTGGLGMMSSLVSKVFFLFYVQQVKMLKENHVHQMWIKSPLKIRNKYIEKLYKYESHQNAITMYCLENLVNNVLVDFENTCWYCPPFLKNPR